MNTCEDTLDSLMSWELKLYPCCSSGSRPPSPLSPMTNSFRFVSLQKSCLTISSKGHKELSRLIKTGQLAQPHLKTCIIYSGSLLGKRLEEEWSWEDVGRDKEINGNVRFHYWYLCKASSQGRILVRGWWKKIGSTQSLNLCFWQMLLSAVVF